MTQIVLIETICYFGIILSLPVLAARGKLTEHLFALLLAAPLGLILITAGLDANLSSPDPYPFGLIALSIGTLISTILSYLIARWAYKQLFRRK